MPFSPFQIIAGLGAAAIIAAACNAIPTVPAAAPTLQLPVRCEVGKTCLVQKLADHDAGPGRRDHRCGTLTTDGHDGIDIRLRTMQDMAQGYAVVAAAAGVVLRTRDGEPDISVHQRAELDGRDAGNAVVIDHGNGWESQYSHLKRGSVNVRPGQRVAAGDVVGVIGMSGNSEFPHLHFSVRADGKPIDPFTGIAIPGPCNAKAASPGLWSAAAARALAYTPTAAIAIGLSSRVPPRAVADRAAPPSIEGSFAPLLIWADIIGAQDGDIQIFEITGPDGVVVHSQTVPIVKGGLSWFAYSGKRAPGSGWSRGRYVATYVLARNGVTLVRESASATIS